MTQTNARKEIESLAELVYLGPTSVTSFTNIEVNATKKMSAEFSQVLGNIDTALVSTSYVLKDANGTEETVDGGDQSLTTGGDSFNVSPATPWQTYTIYVNTTVLDKWAESDDAPGPSSGAESADFSDFSKWTLIVFIKREFVSLTVMLAIRIP